MDSKKLHKQNLEYANTFGISANNQTRGFLPAFKDTDTGRVEVARLRDGRIAPMHLISNLPEDWALALDDQGGVVQLKTSITAGFIKDGRFYSRDEAKRACDDSN